MEKCRKQRSSAWQPSRPLKILFHLFESVVKRNLSTRKQALKIQLREFHEKRSLARSQPLPLEERQRQFCLQLRLSQFG